MRPIKSEDFVAVGLVVAECMISKVGQKKKESKKKRTQSTLNGQFNIVCPHSWQALSQGTINTAITLQTQQTEV
jgi:hypothetical protein